jgi:hypothetical protein
MRLAQVKLFCKAPKVSDCRTSRQTASKAELPEKERPDAKQLGFSVRTTCSHGIRQVDTLPDGRHIPRWKYHADARQSRRPRQTAPSWRCAAGIALMYSKAARFCWLARCGCGPWSSSLNAGKQNERRLLDRRPFRSGAVAGHRCFGAEHTQTGGSRVT